MLDTRHWFWLLAIVAFGLAKYGDRLSPALAAKQAQLEACGKVFLGIAGTLSAIHLTSRIIGLL